MLQRFMYVVVRRSRRQDFLQGNPRVNIHLLLDLAQNKRMQYTYCCGVVFILLNIFPFVFSKIHIMKFW